MSDMTTNQYTSRAMMRPAATPAPVIVVTSRDSRRAAIGFLGAVALSAAWKEHRVLGFLLGGMISGAAYNAISPPPTTIY